MRRPFSVCPACGWVVIKGGEGHGMCLGRKELNWRFYCRTCGLEWNISTTTNAYEVATRRVNAPAIQQR